MFIHKSDPSRVQFTLSFESRIGNFPKTLLLVSWAKIQYTRDAKDSIYEETLTNIDSELYCYSNEFPFDAGSPAFSQRYSRQLLN